MGIPPAPRGMPQIEVAFDIDANGIVHVSAKDMATGNEQKIEIKSSSGLTEDEIQKMVKDAESHADEDRAKKQAVETKNQAENLVYSTRKSLKEIGDKVDGATRKTIEDAASDLEEAIKGDDVAAIEAKMNTLQEAAYKLSEAAYQAAQGQPGADGGPSGDGSAGATEDEVVEDAEFEVIDEN
jgi:molecular chaperone DnaK